MIYDDKGNPVPIMPTPMGAADFSLGDFEMLHPTTRKPVPFGIEPASDVELTVVNLFNQEVTRIFTAGAQPYFIKKIKQDVAEAIVVETFI